MSPLLSWMALAGLMAALTIVYCAIDKIADFIENSIRSKKNARHARYGDR